MRDRGQRLRNFYTGTGSISVTESYGYPFHIETIRLHLATAPTTAEDFVFDLISAEDARHSVNYLTEDMNGVTDIVFSPDQPLHQVAGDSFSFGWTNTDARTFGLEVIHIKKTVN